MVCRLCRSGDLKFILLENNYEISQCVNCDLVQIRHDFKKAKLMDYYNEYLAGDKEKIYRAFFFRADIFRKIIKKIDRLVPDRGKLLDVGAAVGNFIKIAQDDGWQTTGLEINESAAAFIKEKLGLEAKAIDLLDHNDQIKYRVVTFIDTLEHLNEPLDYLKKACLILENNGIIYLRVPNIKLHLLKTKIMRSFNRHYQGLELPSHICHFSPQTLKLILEKSGFVGIDVFPGSQEFLRKGIIKKLFQPIVYLAYYIFKINVSNTLEASAVKFYESRFDT